MLVLIEMCQETKWIIDCWDQSGGAPLTPVDQDRTTERCEKVTTWMPGRVCVCVSSPGHLDVLQHEEDEMAGGI